MNLFDPRICPAVALVDPDLTLSAPRSLTAATGMDALSHAVDSLHCRLRRACTDPADVEARCGMAQASLVAGLAVGITDVSGCHCLAEAIGAVYDKSHGVCCAATMPVIMEYNLDSSVERYARLAAAFGIDIGGLEERDAAIRAVDYVRDLNADLGIPPLSDLIRTDDLDVLAEKAAANTSAPSNPRAVDAAAFREMFATAFPAHAA